MEEDEEAQIIQLPDPQITNGQENVGKDLDDQLIDRHIADDAELLNRFAVRIFKELPYGDKNQVICSVDVFASFAMLLIGTDRESKSFSQLNPFILSNFGYEGYDYHKLMKSFQNVLQVFVTERCKLRPNYHLSHVIRLLIDKRAESSDNFKILIKRYFNIEFDKIDFEKDWDVIDKQIIKLIQQEFYGKDIRRFRVNIDKQTQIVILSAVEFKSKWMIEFPSNQIKEEYFYNEIERSKVQMMAILGMSWNFIFIDRWDSYIIEIPFNCHSLSFYLILPREMDGIPKLLDGLNFMSLNNAIKSMCVKCPCNIFLPKFKLECDYDFAKLYHNYRVFNIDTELTEIGGSHQIQANNILHKVVFEISESGVYHATPLKTKRSDIIRGPILRADHPFVFLVKDNRTSTWVFMGKVHSL